MTHPTETAPSAGQILLPLSALAVGLGLAFAPVAPAQTTDTGSETATEETEPAAEATEEGAAEGTAEDGEASTAEAAAEDATDPLAGLTAETVIATVGDYELTLGELIAVRQALPQQYQSLPPEVLYEGLSEQLINQTILAVQARKAGIADRARVTYNLKNLQNSTLADSFMREEMTARLNADALQAAYEERYADAEPVEEIRASHILVDSEEKAIEIRSLFDSGADFAELAQEHGTDGTATRGGDLGWFVKSDMVPDFAEAAFALETGTVSQPVETPFGWHLIQLNDRRERAAPPLEEVRDDIVQELAGELREEIIKEAQAAVAVSRPETPVPPAALLADDLLEDASSE